MLVEHHPAFVLHARPYRDSSLLVDLLTREYGCISLVAKGGRQAKNHQRYFLQPFVPLSLSWHGKSQLKTLRGLESQGEAYVLKETFLYSGFYVNELLSYLLLPEDPQPEIFELYKALLSRLSERSPLEPCLRRFEFNLLQVLGYGLDFSFDANSGNEILPENDYLLINDSGFVHKTDGVHQGYLTINGQHLQNIAAENYSSPETLRVAKHISRIVFQAHLKGRALKSRELFT